eukprot:CAMPEP_0168481358 /NCGR_PEP_ID=MMETSP0228-20121227/64470_1 /TAXON_ID=133427 /ORGANISM="Protoceratium reticulatum, Strain CCCM 535 (=CCMP 1889)" /LENGTH=35 /DNA_ID= /DNA_START= /DNA_END= /DNA_ORIENTATION=
MKMPLEIAKTATPMAHHECGSRPLAPRGGTAKRAA